MTNEPFFRPIGLLFGRTESWVRVDLSSRQTEGSGKDWEEMKQDCVAVRDLMPLYMDDAASRRMVKEHLAQCPACAGLWAEMKHGRVE